LPNKWPADRVERRPIEALIPYARNSRTHSDAQVAQIAASMKEWGWTNPVLVDEAGMIIAGHGRVLAARKLGLAEVPVMVAEGWTEPQKRAYVLADNQLALNAGWDMDLLSNELADLQAQGFDLGLTGFSDIDALLAGAGTDGSGASGQGTSAAGSLAERFGVPPFSVLRAAEGWWQDRKRAWLALGIQSEVGRGENLLKFSDTINEPDPAKRKAKNGKRKAATFGQDLMRGEHVVGGNG
jgi:ParB-like chromosome segregation protein Spo0J